MLNKVCSTKSLLLLLPLLLPLLRTIQVHRKETRISWKSSIFSCQSFERLKLFYYIDLLQIQLNIQSFCFLSFWCLWLTDTSRKSRTSQKTPIIKGCFKHKCQASVKYVNFYAFNAYLGLLWNELYCKMYRGIEPISPWQCVGVMEAQVALIAAFRSSALLGRVSLNFLLTTAHRFPIGFRSGQFEGQSSTATLW